jgi:hypothetical protein
MEMAVKTVKGAARGAGRPRRWEILPCRWHHGEASPLSPLLHGFLGSLPHGDGIHGEAKTWLLAVVIRGWRISITPSRVAVNWDFFGRPKLGIS